MALRLGQKVKLAATGEVGVIIWLWTDESGDTDAYVAFFGEAFPNGSPKQQPYVLRYYTASLIPLDEGGFSNPPDWP